MVIIFHVLLILAFTSIYTSDPIPSLHTLSTNTVLKTWEQSNNISKLNEFEKLPSEMQEQLKSKLMPTIRRFFLSAAIWLSKPENIDIKINIPEQNDILDTTYSGDGTRILMQTKKRETDAINMMLAICNWSVPPSSIQYTFDLASCGALSGNGKACAVYNKKNKTIDLYAIKTDKAPTKIPDTNNYIKLPKLAKTEDVERILLNHRNTLCIVTIKDNAAPEKYNLIIYDQLKDEPFSIKDVTDFEINTTFDTLLIMQNKTYSIWKANNQTNRLFEKLWQITNENLSFARLSVDGALCCIGTLADQGTEVSGMGYQLTIKNSIDGAEVRTNFGSSIKRFKDCKFLSQEYIVFKTSAPLFFRNEEFIYNVPSWKYEESVPFLMPGTITNFILWNEWRENFNKHKLFITIFGENYLGSMSNQYLHDFEHKPLDFHAQPIGLYYEISEEKIFEKGYLDDKVPIINNLNCYYMNYAQTMFIVKNQDTNDYYIRFNKFAGNFTDQLKNVEKINLKSALILHKIITNPTLKASLTLHDWAMLIKQADIIKTFMYSIPRFIKAYIFESHERFKLEKKLHAIRDLRLLTKKPRNTLFSELAQQTKINEQKFNELRIKNTETSKIEQLELDKPMNQPVIQQVPKIIEKQPIKPPFSEPAHLPSRWQRLKYWFLYYWDKLVFLMFPEDRIRSLRYRARAS